MTKSVRKRFHELSLGRNDRLGLGTSKIEVLAKNTKKNLGKSMIFLVFPACGVGFLTSLLQIGTCLGFAAIFLTANALCSPVRKENPASRACGKKSNSNFAGNNLFPRSHTIRD